MVLLLQAITQFKGNEKEKDYISTKPSITTAAFCVFFSLFWECWRPHFNGHLIPSHIKRVVVEW